MLNRLAVLCSLLVLVITISTAHAQTNELQSAANIYRYPKPVQIAGDLTLKDQAGRTISLKDLRGKVVLLHFWSINCPACKIEDPLLDQLKRNLGNSGLEILAVNLVDPAPVVAQHAITKNSPFPVLIDGGHGFGLKTVNLGGRNTAFLVSPAKEAVLEVPGFPTTYIFDCSGNAVGYSVGVARWDSPAATSFLRSLLADSKTCKLSMHQPIAPKAPVRY